jgi:prephenate dehydrogenase
METVAIVGVGLIGGSFGLALREAGFRGRILGVSSPKTIQTAIDRGAIDEGADFRTAAAIADLVLLAAPILTILEQVDAIDEFARGGTLVTDAGSTKAMICRQAQDRVHRALFLGGHPMAGKERSGISEAEAGLFRDRPWALCPNAPELLDEGRVVEFLHWLRAIGARPVTITPQDHDRTVAFTSHLPQLLSTALAASIQNVEHAQGLSGPALLDMTRLAASPYRVWRDILLTNEDAIRHALATFLGSLTELTSNFDDETIRSVFEIAETVAGRLRSSVSH